MNKLMLFNIQLFNLCNLLYLFKQGIKKEDARKRPLFGNALYRYKASLCSFCKMVKVFLL